MNSKKTLLNLSYSILSQAIVIFLGILIPRIMVVEYGSEVNGLLNSVSQIIVYLSLFESGIQSVAMQALYRPVRMNDCDEINGILSAVHKNYNKIGRYYLFSLLGLALVYPMLIQSETIDYLTVFAVVLFSGMGNVVLFFVQGKYRILLQAEGKTYILTNIQTIITVLNSVMKIVFLKLGFPIGIVVFASFCISMLQAAYIIYLIKRKYSWINLTVSPNETALQQKNAMVVHQIANLVFQNTDVLILTMFCGLKIVSVYSMYKLIVSYINTFLRAVYDSGSFALGQIYNTDKKQYVKLIDAVEVFFGGGVFAIYTVVLALLVPFIRLYTAGVTDIEYVDGFLVILFVVAELLTFIRLPMLYTINYAGHFKNTLVPTIIETVINLVASLLAVNAWGIHGVLLGTICALVYRDIDILLYSNRKLLHRAPFKTIVIYLVDIGVCVVLSLAFWFGPIRISNYLDFVKFGILLTMISGGVYAVVLCGLFGKERKLLFSMVKTIINRKDNEGD